jgi:hypothetical protein
VAKERVTKRPKLTVRPTKEELERLHELAGNVGYDSLSAYLVDRGLCDGGVLPRERHTLESLLRHVRLLTLTVEEEGHQRRAGILDPVPSELLGDLALRAAEALRLINLILGSAAAAEGAREAA